MMFYRSHNRIFQIYLLVNILMDVHGACTTQRPDSMDNKNANKENSTQPFLRLIKSGLENGVQKIFDCIGRNLNVSKVELTSKQWEQVKRVDNSSDSFVFDDGESDNTTIVNKNNNNNETTTVPVTILDRSIFDAPDLCPENQRMGRDNRCHILL